MEDDTPLTSDEFSRLILPVKPEPGKPVAVALSGGADSLALTVMLGQWCASHDVPLTALTVDHGLRPDSAGEARQVGAWLEKYNIPHVILKWHGDKPHSNIQDQARLARYRLMGRWCQQNKVGRLFLGHHQGDQAETFLIRLFRGSGVDGLSAMKIHSDFPLPLPGGQEVILCRPLLTVPKIRLEATLGQMGQDWIEDPSNHNEQHTRVRIRQLLRHNNIDGLNEQRMAQTAARMGRVQSLLKLLTAELTQAAVIVFPAGYVEVNADMLLSGHEEIALRCLAALIRRVGGGTYAPRLASLESLYDRLHATDFPGQTLGGCLISSRRGQGIIISREVAAIEEIIDMDAHAVTLWDGRFIIECGAMAGRVQKLGKSGWQQASQHYPDLEKLKLARFVRESLPCIISSDGRVMMADFLPGWEKTGFKATFRQ